MRKISFKIGQIIGFGIASLIFFTVLFLILSYVTKKINFTLNNYFIILIFPAVLIVSNTFYRMFKR
ncbi:MAG: hypothetical protein JXB50_06130 [Spirochaetes bacterium]|nr:hypothetical protein [Spirochaetota bacterium]